MNEPDHYRILGVSPKAPRTEIQAAYRRRLRQTHPDHGGTETAFHEVQAAWETLSDPRLRREYDLLRFGRRAARRYGRAAARPAHRKVKGWNVRPTAAPPPPDPGPGALVALPWYTRLHRTRVRSKPALWTETAALLTALIACAGAGAAFCAAALNSEAMLPIRALSIPAALVWGCIVAGQILRRRTPAQTAPPPPRARLALAVALAAAAVWTAGPSSPLGWSLAAFALTGTAAPYLARRVRWAAGLRRTVGAALRDYNAFGPAGSRPKADLRTGRLLREILTNLPASRLFVALPATAAARIPHAIVCGDRLALLSAPVARDGDEVDQAGLPDAVAALQAALPDALVHGWVLWPTPPEQAPPDPDGEVDHVAVETAAADIGPWLAAGGSHYDLPVLGALRMRLAAVPTPRSGTRAPAVRA